MVGDILRSARVKQGLTIADIEKGTSIRALYIESIEQGNIDNLPGMVYAKGFVRNYAGFLHLDAEELVQQFAEENHEMQYLHQHTSHTIYLLNCNIKSDSRE